MRLAGIVNGLFWCGTDLVPGDLRIGPGGRITSMGPWACKDAKGPLLDARGAEVWPGAVDLHVHLADAQGEHPIADGFLSGSRAAVLGGVTTLVAFATQRPDESVLQCVRRFRRAADAEGSLADWALHVTPTRWDEATWADLAVLRDRGLRTLKVYTTYREAGLEVPWSRLREVFTRAAALGLTVLVHCEDPDVLRDAEGAGDPGRAAAHPDLRPAESEVRAVHRVMGLAGATGCTVHVVHASHPDTVAAVQGARSLGLHVTCETCPQYLVFDRTALDTPDGHRMLCTPPFRDDAARRAMVEAVAAGEVDVLATDHCPFTRSAKDAGGGDRRRTPMGLPGVGALVPVAWDLLLRGGELSPHRVHRLLSEHPARVAGLWPRKGAIEVGADADVVLVEPAANPRNSRGTLADCYDPWSRQCTTASFRTVVRRGVVVVQDNEVVEEAPGGRCAWR